MLPSEVDSSNIFTIYKYDKHTDVTFDFFENYNNIYCEITYTKPIFIDDMCYQFDNYKSIDYEYIIPFVNKYFSPSKKILDIRDELLVKYNIIPEKCISIYYRGTDKARETELDSFEKYYHKLKDILENENDKNIQIILQTDTKHFIDYMKQKNINNENIIIVEENRTSDTNIGIHNEMPCFQII